MATSGFMYMHADGSVTNVLKKDFATFVDDLPTVVVPSVPVNVESIESYWYKVAPVTKGYQINDKNCGLPPGAVLTPSGSMTIDTPGEVSNIKLTGNLKITCDGVVFRNLDMFTTSGTYGITTAPGVKAPKFIDSRLDLKCTSAAIYASMKAIRCIIRGGSDVAKPRGDDFNLIECLGDKTYRANSTSHVDFIQIQSSTIVTGYKLIRNNLFCGNKDTGDIGNSCLILSYASTPDAGVEIDLIDNHFDGGNYTLSLGGSNTHIKILARGNTFGLNARYGSVTAMAPGVDWDNSNVFLTAGTTLYGRAVAAGEPVH